MDQNIDRKTFLQDAVKYGAGAAIGAGVLGTFLSDITHAGVKDVVWPFPYALLDPEKVRIKGHDTYYSGGCCYGAFHAIIDELRTAVGEPYISMPTQIMYYGSGGGAGWGTLCGAANGAAAFLSLVLTQARSSVLVNELFGWYTQTKFPTDTSNQLAVESKYLQNKLTTTLPQNSCGSILCHVSVTEWCKTADIPVGDAKRKERCARLTGDVAAYAVKLMNDEFQSKFAPLYVVPATTVSCNACHNASGVKPEVASNMECTQCHPTAHTSTKVGDEETLAGAPESYRMSNSYPNPFNPSTTIQFAIPKQESVTISIYDVHGRLVKHLVNSQPFSAGEFKTVWDGTTDAGAHVAAGTYFSRMQAGSFHATSKMVLVK
jgi:hypothetical protein